MLINTYSRRTGISSQIDDSLMEKKEWNVDDEIQTSRHVQYWKDGECVHESADVKLKKAAVFAEGIANKFL